jgi:ribosomal protein S18 acetylase RimI-like enzyme
MIVGVVSLHIFELFHVAGRLGRITSLVVDQRYRRTGIGRLLVKAADHYFASRGCARTEVISSDYRTVAHAFYQALGYAICAKRFLKIYKPL